MIAAVEAISKVISSATGRENAVSAREIEAETGVPERTVRRIISESQLPVIGFPGKGFAHPANVEEIHAVHQIHVANEHAAKRKRQQFEALWKQHGIAFPKP